MPFETNVFVNCPFDNAYLPLLRPLVFCLKYLGYQPRLASERLDAGESRLDKIIGLIDDSKFGIHDISRLMAREAGEYFRLNMPFELGMDVGCRRFSNRHQSKKLLILETRRFRYQAALSDLSGSDIQAHNDEPDRVIEAVRDWLDAHENLRADGPGLIWGRFNEFMADTYDRLIDRGFTEPQIRRLPVHELMRCIDDWLASYRGRNPR